MSIVVKNLVKRYGTQTAVNHISFAINKGEIVGFLGPNGAGKSTTLKIIAGYITANDGMVTVDNEMVNPQQFSTKKKIGYLPESNPLYADMYVREYLSFIASIHQLKNKQSAISDIINTTGLAVEANKKINQLSKGYKQRVGLAAALIHDPEILILDEPTSGLDPNQIIEIRELIKKLGADKTILLSSHILQEVQAICDRVIIINKGKIVADDRLNVLIINEQSNRLILKIKETVAPDVFAGIQNAMQVDTTTWSFQTDDIATLKRKLMEIALNKNLNIISWETETTLTLEEVFKKLTQKTD